MKKFVVISHTHWDREWYLPFSVFRMKLVDLIDRLFAILEKDPDYIFHLDAQTIVLEDYLQIRPEREEELKKRIADGNIRIGPWYLQNDFFLTDGEATVRNLLIGTELAERFGRCGRVGYAPDQFGNISQLPQILAGFGISDFIFGRGFRLFEHAEVRREKRMPTEFEWVGADGTRCLAVHLKCWYNNAQHIPEEPELAKLLLSINEKNFEGLNLSPYILLMNGVDHLEAQEDVREIVSRLRSEGYDIEQKGLDEYMADLRASIGGLQLPVYEGALDKGGDYDVLKGCRSSRIYLKTANVRAQDLVINRLEPLYSYLEASGFKGIYPKDELKYLWKELLKNHPHDNICGCSTDETHRHMEDSFARIGEMGGYLLDRGMAAVAAHIDHPYRAEENYSVTVFNGTERTQSGIAEADLNFLLQENVRDFALFDGDGNPVAYEIAEKETGLLDVFSPLNLPGVLDVERTRIRFRAEDIPSFTARIYAVVPQKQGVHLAPASPARGIENEFYRVYQESGVLVIEDKRTGKIYRDAIKVEDSADKGDSYVYRLSPCEPLVLSPTSVGTPVCGALVSSIGIEFLYRCPSEYDFARDRRSEETAEVALRVTLELRAGSDVIALSYQLRNGARDHRIRLLLDGGLADGRLWTDTPFDYSERSHFENCDVTDSDTHHNSTFAQLTDGVSSLIVYTEGQHEVERVGEGLAFTLLRATGVINRSADTFKPTGGRHWDVPENQVLREIGGRMGLEYSAVRSGADCFVRGKYFRNGLLCRGDSFDRKKYSGGRFAVQSAELERFYYLKDAYEGRTVSSSPLFVCDDRICVTCVKRGERGGTVVRMVNLSAEFVRTSITFGGKLYRTSLSEREENYIGEGTAELSFAPKQIITVRSDNVGA